MKKYKRKIPAFEAESCSEICAYSLAKKKTGMNAIMAISSTMFSTAKARIAEDLDLDQRRLRPHLDERRRRR